MTLSTLPSALDAAALYAEVEGISYTRDSSGVEISHLQAKGIPSWVTRYPGICAAIVEIQDATDRTAAGFMLNRLPAGVTVPVHTDAPGDVVRWHLPLLTNPQALWWDSEGGERHLSVGAWHEVPYQIPHKVSNLGAEPRVHLIVDLA